MNIKLTLLLIFCSIALWCQDKSSNIQPNILVILVDDMGYSDIGCYGSEIPTPNIDKLAKEGVKFTKFYNSARCAPSRAALLTGLYPHQAGMGHQNVDRGIPSYRGKITKNATTIAEVLKANGYATYHVGKWHVGNDDGYWPDDKGFDNYFALIKGAMNYYNQWPWGRRQDSIKIIENGKPYKTPKDFYATKSFTDKAISFIENHDTSSPFFMYMAHIAPHWPLHAPQEDVKKFEGEFLKGWDKIRSERFKKMKKLKILNNRHVLSERFQSIPEWNTLSDSLKGTWDLKMALYAAVMSNLDKEVGNLVASLKKKGQLDNTMIVFLSDNGGTYEDPVPPNAPWVSHPMDGLPGSERSFPSYGTPWANVSNTPFSYFKSYVHEGGIATPLIVRYPRLIKKGATNTKTLGHITDLLPTFLELSNTTYPTQIGDRDITPAVGKSLVSTFRNPNKRGRKELYWEHEFNRAVRVDDWKLVSAYKIWQQPGVNDVWQLYNLKNDPSEQKDLAAKYPGKVKWLSKKYEAWADKMQVIRPDD